MFWTQNQFACCVSKPLTCIQCSVTQMQHLQKGGKLSRMGVESDLSNEMWLAERMPQGTPSSVPLAVVSGSVYLTLIRKSSSFLPLVHQLTKDAHHAMFSNEVLEVKWLTHQTTDWFTHTAHTHTNNVQVCSLQPSGTLNTHMPYCVLSLCLVLKSPGNAPPLKLLRSPSVPSSIPPALGLELH